MDNGKIIALGTPKELKDEFGEEVVIRKGPSLDDVFLKLTGKSLREEEGQK